MEIGKQHVSAVIPTTNHELECRFMSVHASLHNRTISYLLAQILILTAISRDALAVQSRYGGISVAVSLALTLTALHGLVTDLAVFSRTRFLMDLHESVLSQTHRVDLREEFRRVEGRDLWRRVVSGVYLAAITAFAALMLWACWVIGPDRPES